MGEGATEGHSFAELDTNGNGFLSKNEAKADTGLSEHWNRTDTNGDQQIDRAAFAAFETGVRTETPEQQGMPSNTGSGMTPQSKEMPSEGSTPSRTSGEGSGY